MAPLMEPSTSKNNLLRNGRHFQKKIQKWYKTNPRNPILVYVAAAALGLLQFFFVYSYIFAGNGEGVHKDPKGVFMSGSLGNEKEVVPIGNPNTLGLGLPEELT
eukprot:7753662-Pyramimonas_sp.AAC.1